MKIAALLTFAVLLPMSASAYTAFAPHAYGSYKDCIELSPLDLPTGANPYVFCRPLKPAPPVAKNETARELIVPVSYETGAEGAR